MAHPCASPLACDSLSNLTLAIVALAAVVALCARHGKTKKSTSGKQKKARPAPCNESEVNAVDGVSATDRPATPRHLSPGPDAVVYVQVHTPSQQDRADDGLPGAAAPPIESTSIEIRPDARAHADAAETGTRTAPRPLGAPRESRSSGRSGDERLTAELTFAPRDASLAALREYVQLLISEAGGSIGARRYIIDGTQPIRLGLFSVQCRCKTQFGKPVDVLFFASRAAWQRQCEMLSMRCVQAWGVDVRDRMDASVYDVPACGARIMAPCSVITDATQPLDDVLEALPWAQREMTVAAVASQLAAQLARLHRQRSVLCGVRRSNIVVLAGGAAPAYTFLELASCRPEGHKTEGRNFGGDVRALPPEVAQAKLSRRPTPITRAMDVWQLGVLLFELYTGGRYWPPGESDYGVLAALTGALPHERDPSALALAAEGDGNSRRQATLVERMLRSDPAARPPMAEVEHKLLHIAGSLYAERSASISMRSLPTGSNSHLTA